ncbi:Hypp9198 [Branchiostoma lanceolatum]|uniref:Hypp9198 protein n=1 Tax=Branchiostoma lanceolatum TaxID=7740 RepID=A0A8K0EG92_BRALA|nr:Hypp9198 [Branchiostoma lanceolatum]
MSSTNDAKGQSQLSFADSSTQLVKYDPAVRHVTNAAPLATPVTGVTQNELQNSESGTSLTNGHGNNSHSTGMNSTKNDALATIATDPTHTNASNSTAAKNMTKQEEEAEQIPFVYITSIVVESLVTAATIVCLILLEL